MVGQPQKKQDDQEAGPGRDGLLLRLLKTPPQPRPKRERDKKTITKKQPKKVAPAK